MRLYVIGNGFDVYHGLNTTYRSFGLYLKSNYYEVYDCLIEYFGFGDPSEDPQSSSSALLWSDFEANMSELDTLSILEDNSDSLPNYAAEGFRDRDRYTFDIEMERCLELLTTTLYQAFKRFILDVDFPAFDHCRAIKLDQNSIYLTFNYTDTLTRYYSVPGSNILFIHGQAQNDGSDLILGHGIDPNDFKEEEVNEPEGLSDDDYSQWFQDQADRFDYSYERGKSTINDYFSQTFKGTDAIIKKNEAFFSNLNDVDEVYVLGHSLSCVDLPYFLKLSESVCKNAKWVSTYYDPSEKEHHNHTLKQLGVSNISIVRMEEI